MWKCGKIIEYMRRKREKKVWYKEWIFLITLET